MDILEANKRYEAWLESHIPIIKQDLRAKRAEMATKPFAFLRATFFRWAQVWRQLCPELTDAPEVLGVGDLHIENFGTWRDVEGRLIWGVNDFDEAAVMPYCNDLVRLATSAAVRKNKIGLSRAEICKSILDGYKDSLEAEGRPFVVGKEHGWLRDLARQKKDGDPQEYWDKLDAHHNVAQKTPPEIIDALNAALPEKGLKPKIIHRQGGLGSLGRRRYTAIAQWRDANVAREAKELTSSAWHWDLEEDFEIQYRKILADAVRVPDPFLQMHKHWVIRRLAPDCSKLELGEKLAPAIARQLLYSMGWETGNIHLGSKNAVAAVLRDLRRRPKTWFGKSVERMVSSVQKDFEAWSVSQHS